jgi:hypothetical protein
MLQLFQNSLISLRRQFLDFLSNVEYKNRNVLFYNKVLCLSRHRVQNGSGAHPASYPMGNRGSFPGGKATGAWSWPLTSIYCRGQECVELYLHSQYIFMTWCLVKHRDKFTFTFCLSRSQLLKREYVLSDTELSLEMKRKPFSALWPLLDVWLCVLYWNHSIHEWSESKSTRSESSYLWNIWQNNSVREEEWIVGTVPAII